MLSTPFCSHIIHCEPPRGFLVPKFSTYDGSNDPFDHIMHYRQLMTLDIGNEALLCKVFPASLQGQTLSWFHRLPPNSLGNFRDLSEAFVGQYLCSARHKQNISTLQNIKMQDNESLREFVKRFGQVILQVEAYSMDVVLQIFKRSICPGTPFFESLAKKPLATMDDLHPEVAREVVPNFRTGQGRSIEGRKGQVALKGRPSHHFPYPMRSFSLWSKTWPTSGGLDPSEQTHPEEIIVKKCAFHKEHGHTTETCRCLHYLVERLIKAGHLKQYLRSDAGGRDASQNHNSRAPRAPAASKVVINYINGGPSDEDIGTRAYQLHPAWDNWGEGRPRPIDGTIIFPPVDLTRILQPHRDALIMSLEIGDFDVRRILVDLGSSADLVQASVISHMGHSLTGLENLGRILSGFNGSSTTSLGDIVLPVQAGSVTLNVQFSVDGQIDLYGSQLAARQCYQIAQEAGTSQEDASLPESSHARDQ
uniref:Retrotransposon gag domain-containing protein n=1 Tax=Vitis vinifera TaxID=29760 RepID=A5BBM6_VITVI|nr:hypothetical protein VITISV_012279 [Vitis vinifera]